MAKFKKDDYVYFLIGAGFKYPAKIISVSGNRYAIQALVASKLSPETKYSIHKDIDEYMLAPILKKDLF